MKQSLPFNEILLGSVKKTAQNIDCYLESINSKYNVLKQFSEETCLKKYNKFNIYYIHLKQRLLKLTEWFWQNECSSIVFIIKNSVMTGV